MAFLEDMRDMKISNSRFSRVLTQIKKASWQEKIAMLVAIIVIIIIATFFTKACLRFGFIPAIGATFLFYILLLHPLLRGR